MGIYFLTDTNAMPPEYVRPIPITGISMGALLLIYKDCTHHILCVSSIYNQYYRCLPEHFWILDTVTHKTMFIGFFALQGPNLLKLCSWV